MSYRVLIIAAALSSTYSVALSAAPLSREECRYLQKITEHLSQSMAGMGGASSRFNLEQIKPRLTPELQKSFDVLADKRDNLTVAVREFIQATDETTFHLRVCAEQ